MERGVAYHHSGMLPILREFVELCFQQKLVRLVFATETLAVGVNMPARSATFTQLDKPDDTGSKQGHRWLRVDEFWQMAGRAGRRGLDSVGYVVYAPTLSVAGLRNLCPVHEMSRMLTADVMGATSQLLVDRPFAPRRRRNLRLGKKTRPVWADVCRVGLRAPPSFQRGRRDLGRRYCATSRAATTSTCWKRR